MRARRARTAAAASSSPPASAVAGSQRAGTNRRQSSGAEAVSVAACTLTAIWQFPTFPSVPEYCRATPGEAVPSLGNPVSSTTHASGPTTSTALAARRSRTGSTSHVEEETNCCNPWWSTPSRAAIGCIDVRRPSSSNPRRCIAPFSR